MLKWFRKGLSPFQTALAMVGARRGDQVAFIGATDVELAAQLALVTGLNGQMIVVDRSEEQPRVEASAARAGALVEFRAGAASALPVEAATVDVLVLAVGLVTLEAFDRTKAIEEAMRVLRPGGRTIIIEGIATARRPAGADVPALDPPVVLRLLEAQGARAVRTLASVGGRTYYEARKPRVDPA